VTRVTPVRAITTPARLRPHDRMRPSQLGHDVLTILQTGALGAPLSLSSTVYYPA